MKKFLALILAAAMALTMVSALAEEAVATPEALTVLDTFGDIAAADAEYAPNPDYDKYTVIEYYIETADANVLATVSAKADDSEYCMEFSFYGDDQKVVCNAAGEVSFDATGFMSSDTPAMIAYVIENAVWSAMPAAAAEGEVTFGNLTAADAEYAPNPDYDKYTVIEYYIETADANVLATVSAKEDDSEYCMEFSFYGDDQKVVCNAAGEVSFDATGFMSSDTPAMIAYVIENAAAWAPIAK